MKENRRSRIDNLIISLIDSGDCPEFIKDMDWNQIFRIARANRLDGIIYDALDRNRLFERLPEKVREKFEESYRQTVINTRIYLETASRIHRAFSCRDIDLLILRGPALGLTLYSRPYLRPFADLDLLIRKADLSGARKLLGELGFSSLPGTLPDLYFEKYHLHLSFQDPKKNTIIELHWALDHPYTLYTIDYSVLFSAKEMASFENLTLPVLSPEDRLITLCLHLIKHCPFLSLLIKDDDLTSLLLRGRWMIWLLDIHLLLIQQGDLFNWKSIRDKADNWGMSEQLTACLAAVEQVFHGNIPQQYMPQNIQRVAPLLKRWIYQSQLRILRGEEKSRPSDHFLFSLRSDAIFRPIRAIDLTRYLFPPREYIRRKYHIDGLSLYLTYPRHIISGLVRLIQNFMDLKSR